MKYLVRRVFYRIACRFFDACVLTNNKFVEALLWYLCEFFDRLSYFRKPIWFIPGEIETIEDIGDD